MDIKPAFKLGKIAIKGIGKGVARGGKELAVITGKAAVLAAVGAVVTYVTSENNSELKVLAARNSKKGLDELEDDIREMVEELEKI